MNKKELTETDNPGDLRQSVLKLAAQGKLVPQQKTDGCAADSIVAIASLRDMKSSAKSVKKLRDIDESRTATSLPTSWTWCRLGDIVMEFRYGTSRKCERVAKSTPVLRIPNIQDGLIDADDLKYTAMPKGEFEELKLAPGDLLLVRSNGSEDLVGRSAVVGFEPATSGL